MGRLARGAVLAMPLVMLLASASPDSPFAGLKPYAIWGALATMIAVGLWSPIGRPGSLCAAFGLFVLVVAIADVFGAHPWRSLLGLTARHEGLPALALPLAYYAALRSLPGGTRSLLGPWILAGTVAAVLALSQWPGSLRPAGAFGNPNFLAALLVIAIGFSALMLREAEGWVRPVLMTATAVMAAALFASGSRAAFVGSIAGIAVYAWRAPQTRHVTLVGAVLALITGLALGHRIALGIPDVVSRLDLWRIFAGLALEHPWLGVGQDGITVLYDNVLIDRAYSLPLDLVLAGGLFALAAYGRVLVMVFRRAASLRSASASAAVPGLLTAYLVGDLFTFDTMVTTMTLVALMAWLDHESAPREAFAA